MSDLPQPDNQDDLKDQLREIATDLLTLEVNTILKESITATKMPSPAHALLDILTEYDVILTTKLGALEPPLPLREVGTGASTQQVRAASLEAFDTLRERAIQRFSVLQKSEDERNKQKDCGPGMLMLTRIMENSDDLKGLFARLNARDEKTYAFTRKEANSLKLVLLPEEKVLLRKIWEVGTEEIMMQTVIHLDGDVITRIQPLCMKPDKQPVLGIHNDAIKTSTEFWGKLVDIVGTFMSNAVKLVRSKA